MFFLIKLLTILFLAFAQVAVIPFLINPFDKLQLFLSLAIAISLIAKRKNNYFSWILLFGVILSFYSLYPFLIIVAALFSTAFMLFFLSSTIFTNKSRYSIIILSVTTTCFYNIFLTFLKFLTDITYFKNTTFILSLFLNSLFLQVILNTIGAMIIFIVFKKLYGRSNFSKI